MANIESGGASSSLFARKGKLGRALTDIEISSPSLSSKSSEPTLPKKGKLKKAEQDAFLAQEKAYLDAILGLVEPAKGRDMAEIKAKIASLVALSGDSNLRVLAAGKTEHSYGLTFAWDDDAVTRIGTGLHKVPLARMDQMFMTLQSQGGLLLQEVIRIIGPFPNVLNTLSGMTKVVSGREMTFTIDSVIDGTGKELVGEEPRCVNLKVPYASERALIVDAAEEGEDPKYLIFMGEDDVDGKLYDANLGEDKKNKI